MMKLGSLFLLSDHVQACFSFMARRGKEEGRGSIASGVPAAVSDAPEPSSPSFSHQEGSSSTALAVSAPPASPNETSEDFPKIGFLPKDPEKSKSEDRYVMIPAPGWNAFTLSTGTGTGEELAGTWYVVGGWTGRKLDKLSWDVQFQLSADCPDEYGIDGDKDSQAEAQWFSKFLNLGSGVSADFQPLLQRAFLMDTQTGSVVTNRNVANWLKLGDTREKILASCCLGGGIWSSSSGDKAAQWLKANVDCCSLANLPKTIGQEVESKKKNTPVNTITIKHADLNQWIQGNGGILGDFHK